LFNNIDIFKTLLLHIKQIQLKKKIPK